MYWFACGLCSKFLADLRLCVDKPELLGPLFRRFLERKVFLYEAYCRNKPVSEYIVSENEVYFHDLRNKLSQKLQVSVWTWRICEKCKEVFRCVYLKKNIRCQ